jgi:hypothetical protein
MGRREGMTTLCRSWLYPPVRDYEFHLWTNSVGPLYQSWLWGKLWSSCVMWYHWWMLFGVDGFFHVFAFAFRCDVLTTVLGLHFGYMNWKLMSEIKNIIFVFDSNFVEQQSGKTTRKKSFLNINWLHSFANPEPMFRTGSRHCFCMFWCNTF